MEINTAFSLIIKGLDKVTNQYGFSVAVPSGLEKGAVPVSHSNGCTTLLYDGAKGSIKIELFEGKISLFCSSAGLETAVDNDYKRCSVTLFDEAKYDERDIKYIVNDFTDAINECYSKKSASSKKLPQPVSKSAAKSGTVYYDLITLGSRFVLVYPELRDIYKQNIEKYGEFLADDFFLNYGNQKVRETVSKNDPAQMKKLFNMLNDVYNDGTNQTQSVIVVTILGSLYDDEQLLANCVDYMDDLLLPVTETNKLLRKAAVRAKLEHPPLYKPKKKKAPGFLNQLNGGN